MNSSVKAITLFVAMPYTSFGPNAKWKKPEHVEAFYQNAGDRIAEVLGRPVELKIERYRTESGLVHETMFRAAYASDVFIADLTGGNPNVFFELGIRYGVRRAITILTSQEETTPFDLAPMRLVRYANRPDNLALQEIAQMVRTGFDSSDYSDSPVLGLLDLEVVDRPRWLRVSGKRVQDLLTAAMQTHDPQIRLSYLLQAVEDDPFSFDARLTLARDLRSRQDYGSGLRVIGEALERFPRSSSLHKERGLILDRMTAAGDARLDEAIAAYRFALELDKSDADLHSCLGGALRRKGLSARDKERTQYLQESLNHYQHAVGLQRHSTYAGLNVLRLLMLMSGQVVEPPTQLQEYLRRIYHLCAFEATDAGLNAEEERWWKLFDFGDTLVFSKEQDQALDTYRQAIELVPSQNRAETLLSPIRTWQELLESGVLKSDIREGAESVFNLLKGSATPTFLE